MASIALIFVIVESVSVIIVSFLFVCALPAKVAHKRAIIIDTFFILTYCCFTQQRYGVLSLYKEYFCVNNGILFTFIISMRIITYICRCIAYCSKEMEKTLFDK